MTANVPASSWPPPASLPAPPRTPLRQSSSSTNVPQVNRPGPSRSNEEAFEENSRPNKRRKVDVPTTGVPTDPPVIVKEEESETRWCRTSRPIPYTWQETGDVNSHGGSSPLEPPSIPVRPRGALGQSTTITVEDVPSRRVRINIPVPTVPDSMVSPDDAPHLMQGKPAGYFPWSGKHPEDVLSESTVKQGYFDRPPNPPEKELNTAKAPLYNTLKHKAGLESLTTLFSLVLEQKDKHCAISSASSFKPPPRVTLTETKRKSWIADLANNDVPLRKLSRTIPQGIRGQILLEQCLTNAIPLSRAIWFAKCVGANEIRTLKRKGTTSAVANLTESKWLREWTTTVENFIETVLSQSGQPDWRTSIQYSLRLAARLYSENLMDRDHYLDWVVRSFSIAKFDHAPFWLMNIHIHREDLVKFRRRGRKLAAALLEKLSVMDAETSDKSHLFKLKLSNAARGLVTVHPMCFLDPENWPQYQPILRKCLRAEVTAEAALYSRLCKMNEQCMGTNKYAYCAKPTTRESIIQILDSAKPPFDVIDTLSALHSCCPHNSTLFMTVLEWATSRFRFGFERIYLAARLFKKWATEGHDVDGTLYDFIASLPNAKSVARDAASKLVAELSRAQTFSLSRYLQWLTVRGLPKENAFSMLEEIAVAGTNLVIKIQDDTNGAGFLTELCLHNCDSHIVNLRNSMLSRAGYDVRIEAQTFDTITSLLAERLTTMSLPSQGQLSLIGYPAVPFHKLGWTLRIKIARWLRGQTIAMTRSLSGNGLPSAGDDAAATLFHFIRTVLENMNEMAVLADVIGIMATLPQESLLAGLTDTVHQHMKTFWALGAFEPLYKRLCQAYVSLRKIKSAMTQFTISLLDLCQNAPIKMLAPKILQQDLVLGDRSRVLAACSPFSEGIAESLQQAGNTFIEDFEAILQAETNMNEHTMASLFAVLTERIEKEQSSDMTITLCHLLARLKTCRKSQADNLITIWLSRFLSSRKITALLFGLKALIGTRSIGFGDLTTAFQTFSKDQVGPMNLNKLVYLLLENENCLSYAQAHLQYALELDWVRFVHNRSPEALRLFGAANASVLDKSQDHLLSGLLQSATPDVGQLTLSGWLPNKLNRLLDLGNPPESSEADPAKILAVVSPLSLPLCKLRLQIWSNSVHNMKLDNVQGSFSKVLSSSQRNPSAESMSCLPYLLEAAGSRIANKLFNDSQQDFLDALPRFLQAKTPVQLPAISADLPPLAQTVEHAFSLAQATSAEINVDVLTQLVEKLNTMYRLYSTISSSLNPAPSQPAIVNQPAGGQTSAPVSSPIMPSPAPVVSSQLSFPHEHDPKSFLKTSLDYLELLLQTVCLQRTSLARDYSKENPNLSKQAQQMLLKIVLIVACIGTQVTSLLPSILEASRHQKARELTDFVFMVVATLMDHLSDELRAHGAKILKDKMMTDERIKWLFGSVNAFGSSQAPELGQGLILVKDGKGPIGEFKPKLWEVLESGTGKESETCIGLGLFGARRT